MRTLRVGLRRTIRSGFLVLWGLAGSAAAAEPLHFDKSSAAVGHGLAFGKAMASANPKVKIGLVPCAVGGTSIKVWTPGAMDRAYRNSIGQIHDAYLFVATMRDV